MEDKMVNEHIRKMAKGAMDDALKRMANAQDAETDPDPETVKKIEELEAQDALAPGSLLLDVMENVREMIDLTVKETREWGTSPEQRAEIDKRTAELAGMAIQMYDRLMVGKTLEKLHFMREVEQRNDKNVQKWSERHETL